MNHLVRTCKHHWLELENLHWGRGVDREPFAAPGTPPRYAPDAPVVARHMRLELHFDIERERCWGETTHDLEVLAPSAAEVRFQAVALDIESVTLEGRPVPFNASGETVAVNLPRPAQREDLDCIVRENKSLRERMDGLEPAPKPRKPGARKKTRARKRPARRDASGA